MAIKGYERKGNQLSDLTDIIKAYAVMMDDDDKETPIHKDAMASYSSYIFNSFEDNEVNTHVSSLDNWYNQNLPNLSSSDIERYDLIKRRVGEHQKRYRGFNMQYNIMHDNMEEMKVLLAGGENEDGTIIEGYNDLNDQGKALMAGVIKDKEIQTLQQVIINLKNIIDTKEAEITTYQSVNESHKKLNGDLRKEIEDLKKQADDMLLYP